MRKARVFKPEPEKAEEHMIGDDGMEALVSRIASGAMAQLEILVLGGNQIGDEGMKSFSTALASGAMAQLKELNLYKNQIGDEGMKSFSTALVSGLKFLDMGENPGDRATVEEACNARGICM